MDETLTLVLDELKKLNSRQDRMEDKMENMDTKLDNLQESLHRFEANHELDVVKILETIKRNDKNTSYMLEAFNKRLTTVEKEIVGLGKQ